MKPSRAWMVVRLLLVVSLLVPASAGWCAETQERYIKRLGVDDKYINLEVDGEKVRIPLPEGYEVFTKEEYPEQYEYYYSPALKEIAVPLCGLVNSSDHKRSINGSNALSTRFFFIDIQRSYIQHRLSFNQFRNEMEHKKKYKVISGKTTGKSQFMSKYIIDNQVSLSELHIEKKEFASNDDVFGYTNTHYLFQKIIFSFQFYTLVKNDDDVDRLIKETKSYISLLSKN